MFVSKNVLTVVCGVVPLYCVMRCTVCAQQWTGQRGAFDDLCCVIVAIFSPFFCETNVMETQSAWVRSESGAECGTAMVVPDPVVVKKQTFSIVMILVFLIPSCLFVVLYSQERIAKKSAPVVRVVMAWFSCVSLSVMKWRQKARGRQAWLFFGGSLSLYALI